MDDAETGPRKRVRIGPANLDEGEVRGYDVDGELVLVARVGGRLYALDDMCCHAGCLLSQGTRVGRNIVCPCHEIAFDLTTGENQTDRRICGDQPRREVVELDGAIFLFGVSS